MFKLIGYICTATSTFFLFYRKSIRDWFTYIFLRQTAELFGELLFENKTDCTYPQIFENLDINKLWIYRKFSFTERVLFFRDIENKIPITRDEILKVSGMFRQLGHRKAEKENEYIALCIKQLEAESLFYQKKYSENGRLNRLCGRSAGIIIMLLLI